MKTKNVFFVAFAAIILISCQKSGNNYGIVIDGDIRIFLRDSAGNDLLNPAHPRAFSEDDMKLYYLTDGEKQEIFYPNYDYPRNFIFMQVEPEDETLTQWVAAGSYYVNISLNGYEREERPTSYFRWNETDTDTLLATFDRGGGSLVCEKAWYNGKLVWTREDGMLLNSQRVVQIIK